MPEELFADHLGYEFIIFVRLTTYQLMINTFIKITTCIFLFLSVASPAQQVRNMTSGEIELALKKLNTVGSVLYIAAHPDDENTRLLSYFANEKLVRTGYLSLTRGDGGQNLIGKEQSELLGVIRTQELLAARRIDGAEQFFTRANDFGYTKNPEETFKFWPHDSILADVVWIIRNFKPDVIITRFPTTGEGGHGQHTASAILAGEAYKAAADPAKFTEQLKYVEPWQAKSLWWNTFNFGNNNTQRDDQFHFDAGVFNPLLGKGYGEMAAESRSMHKSQGFGVPANRNKQTEFFKPIDGDTSCKSIYCNLDFTWKRIKGSEKFAALMDKVINEFNAQQPDNSLPLLFAANDELAKITDTYWKQQKQRELNRIILSCAGLWFETVANDFSVVAGDSLSLKIAVIKNFDTDIKINKISFGNGNDTILNKPLEKITLLTFDKSMAVPSTLKNSTPYWLADKHTSGIYTVSDQQLRGTPQNEAALNAVFYFTINNREFTFTTPVMYKWTDPVQGEKYRSLEVRPVVTINFSDHNYLFTDGESKKITLTLRAQKDSVSGNLIPNVIGAFRVTPSSIPVLLYKKEDEQKIILTLLPMPETDNLVQSIPALLNVSVTGNKNIFTSGKSITEIKYDHIPYQTIFSTAEAHLIKIDLKKKGIKIGYIEGAGDAIPQCLQQIGYDVTRLTDDMIENDSLNKYDAIITGVRTYNTNENMGNHYQRIMNYIEQGGNFIVQYNTNNSLGSATEKIGPYPFKISRDRVTDETAAMVFDKPEHPLLNTPNKITAKDFDGWIQERGLYYPSEVSEKYETLISTNDAGEKPLSTGIITCKYGKGNFIYTSLSFFRELPAGIPGAYRLFVNMISAGK